MNTISSPSSVSSPVSYFDCVEAFFECASSCWICADSCLADPHRDDLMECIKLCLKTAEFSAATARMLVETQGQGQPQSHHFLTEQSYPSDLVTLNQQLENCAQTCLACHKLCQQFSQIYEHCLICSKCCQQTVRMLENYLLQHRPPFPARENNSELLPQY